MSRRSLVTIAALVCGLAVPLAPSGPTATADESGGATAPSTIYAGVNWYRGGWRGTASSCRWEEYFLVIGSRQTPVHKTEGGIEYQLYRKVCPGPTTELVWVPDIETRRISYSATAYLERILPDPAATFAPPRTRGVVKVGTWFWIDPSAWNSFAVTAWIPTPTGARWATTTARPVRLLFDPGDGRLGSGAVSCTSAGTRWRVADGDERASPSGCEYTYPHSSVLAANGSTFPARVTIVWDVTWRSSSGAGGYAGQLRTSSSYAMTVREIQALVTV